MSDSTATLAWLADSPMYIDTQQVSGFYDAVVRPEAEDGTITIELTEAEAKKMGGEVSGQGEISISDWIVKYFPFLQGKVSIGGKITGEIGSTDQVKHSIELHSISTPQRQLVQLSIHYAAHFSTDNKRLSLVGVKELANTDWRSQDYISRVPRALAFIDLPGQVEAIQAGLPFTKIIPTAAEFSTGDVVLIYQQLRSKDGRSTPPEYPETSDSPEFLIARRKDYWQWFDDNFSATRAMLAVEEAARTRGRIRWIDYRVPLTKEGDTLHLHICPAEKYDTGVFAYNFIKRGYKHGLRLVGTLKSEPDLNVLAIFEK